MSTLAKFMIVAGADNRPPMLDKAMYDSWESRMELFIEGKENGRMMLNSVKNGPLIWPTKVDEHGNSRVKKYVELTAVEKLQADCDLRAANLMTLQQVQVNTKFLNSLPFEWSKFVTDVKLARDPHTTNYDQLHAYLQQHEIQANEIRIMRERYQDPLALGNAAGTVRNNAAGQGKVIKCYNCQVLDEEQLAFLVDPGIPDGQAVQTTIQQNFAFQSEDLDAYDSDCDDISSAKVVLMANLSSCGSDVLSEVPYTYQTELMNDIVQEMQYFEQPHIMESTDNEITSDRNIILYSKYLLES
ncbi:hypothetical protein Tco_1065342 [Tanacetum coccineum]